MTWQEQCIRALSDQDLFLSLIHIQMCIRDRPIRGSVKVTGNTDTDVVFTDIESGETYVIGYITSGAGDTIKLKRGKWYRVEGAGELTLRPVNVRIE